MSTGRRIRRLASLAGLLSLAVAAQIVAPATAIPSSSPRSHTDLVLSIVDSIVTGGEVSALAYVSSPSGDRVYVANRETQASSIWVIDPRTNTIVDTMGTTEGVPVDAEPFAMTVGYDDTVYVTFGPQRSVASIDTATNTVVQTAPISATSPAPAAAALAVAGAGADDTIYVASDSAYGNYAWILSVLDADPLALDDTIGLPPPDSYSAGVAVTADDTVYLTSFGPPGQVIVVNGRTQAVDDTIEVGMRPGPIVITPDDTVYVANTDSRSISVIDATQGQVVSTINLGLNQSPKAMVFDATSQRVYVATTRGFLMALDTLTNTIDDSMTGLSTNPRAVTISDDGARIYVANRPNSGPEYISVVTTRPPGPEPAPAPAVPPGPPERVVAQPGDRSATVTWSPPTAAGSFPVSHYQATSYPGDRICLAPASSTSCDVTGLINGVAYTFTVRALSGAGWGPESVPSAPVTPSAATRATIQITGSRDATDPRVVRVAGMTTGLVGKQVTPWIKLSGQEDFNSGTGVRTVAADGTFQWSRRSSKGLSVYFEHAPLRSNVVRLPAP